MDSIARTYRQIQESNTQHPMIMVDGVLRHETNSLGQPIHHTYEGIQNFHRWFGKSKAVDQHGRPQVFYHGTNADIESFSHDYVGKGTDALGSGFYFTDDPNHAEHYTKGKDGGNITPVYLRIQKPIDKAKEEKYLTANQIRKMITSAPNHKEMLTNFGEVDTTQKYLRTLSTAIDQYTDIPTYHAMGALHNDFYRKDHSGFLKNFEKHTKHDAVTTRLKSRIVNVFNPKNIKSAIGNDGTFDHPDKITECFDDIALAYLRMLEK